MVQKNLTRWAAAGFLVSVGALGACSSEQEPEVGTRTQALTATQSRVWGFEAPASDWITNNGSVIESSSVVSEGSSSLAFSLNGYTEIESVAVHAPGLEPDQISVDIRLPTIANWGELRLVVKMPSEGVYWHDVGSRQLNQIAAGAFETISFPVSDNLKSALGSTAQDLSFLLVINGPPIGTYQLDNLSVGDEQTAGEGDSPQSTDGRTTVSFTLPSGLNVDDIMLNAEGSLLFDDHVTLGASGHLTHISSMGADGVRGGSASVAHAHIASKDDVWLGSQSLVEGSVSASGTITLEDSSVDVRGVKIPSSTIPRQSGGWTVEWPEEAASDLSIPNDSANVEIIPGVYGQALVRARSTATIRSGTYFFESLLVERQVHLQVDTSHGPVVLYVDDSLTVESQLDYVGGASGDVLIVYLGDVAPIFREALEASVIAPNSTIELRRPSSGGKYVGTFFGKGVHVFSDATVEHRPLNLNAVCPGGEFNGTTCTGGPGSPSSSVNESILIPKGFLPREVFVSGESQVVLEPGALLSTPTSKIVAAPDGTVTLRGGATSPTVVARNGATVEAGATVFGDVLSDAQSTVDGSVAGTVNAMAGVSPPDEYPVILTFPPPTDGDFVLESGRSKILWPGDYGMVRVKSGAKAYMGSGKYRFDSFALEAGAELVVVPNQGLVRADVKEQLDLRGTVSSLGDTSRDLVFFHGGVSPVVLEGSFGGAVISLRADVLVRGGAHEGTFIGDEVIISGGAQLTAGDTPWQDGIPSLVTPDVTIRPDLELPGSVRATASKPGVVTDPDGFDFVVPERLPVAAGNAGDHPATITFTKVDGSQGSCSYQGGSASPTPTTVNEVAKGTEYKFSLCSDGTQTGDRLELTDLEIEIAGDPTFGEVAVNPPLDDGCNGLLPSPVSAEQSRQWIESFSWDSANPFSSSNNVPEWNNEAPTLFPARIYIENEEELALLDQLLIHWDKRPIFQEEWPQDWNGVCGTIDYPSDGEGVWVWAVLPGAMFNAIVNARTSGEIEGDKELFRAVQLTSPPQGMSNSDGSIDLEVLREAGFLYAHLADLPDEIALRDAQFSSGVVQALVSVAAWVWEASKDVIRAIPAAIGFIDRLFGGTTRITADVNVLNSDARFRKLNSSGDVITIRRAWGAESGREISVDDFQIRYWQLNVNPLKFISFPSVYQGRVNSYGRRTMKVAGKSDTNTPYFVDFCLELESKGRAFMTSFLTPSSVCNRTLDIDELFDNNLDEDFTAAIDVQNDRFSAMTEIIDGHDYLHEIVGVNARKAKVLVGTGAHVFSGFQQKAWAPCLGHESLADDVVLSVVSTAVGIVFPPAVFATVPLAIYGTSDIVMTDGDPGHFDRGLATHEYGHYALCEIAHEAGESEITDLIKTWDNLKTETADHEARVINEAFADFFAGQVAGGYNYFNVQGSTRGGGSSTALSTDEPGLDDNLWEINEANDHHIGRIATMLQDVFDGHGHQVAAPSSGESWYEISGGRVRHRRGATCNPTRCRTGDEDKETAALGGRRMFDWFEEFMNERNLWGSYRLTPFYQATANVLLDNTNWCQACLVMEPHFTDQSSADMRDILLACEDPAGETHQYLGDAPGVVRSLNATTCERCPPGQGMAADGRCEECPADTEVAWSGTACSTTVVSESSDGSDVCPHRFVVEVTGASAASGSITHVGAEPIVTLTDDTECESSQVDVEVLSSVDGTTFTPLVTVSSQGDAPQCDVICIEQCDYSPADRFLASGDNLRIEVESTHDVEVILEHSDDSCDPILR